MLYGVVLDHIHSNQAGIEPGFKQLYAIEFNCREFQKVFYAAHLPSFH